MRRSRRLLNGRGISIRADGDGSRRCWKTNDVFHLMDWPTRRRLFTSACLFEADTRREMLAPSSLLGSAITADCQSMHWSVRGRKPRSKAAYVLLTWHQDPSHTLTV